MSLQLCGPSLCFQNNNIRNDHKAPIGKNHSPNLDAGSCRLFPLVNSLLCLSLWVSQIRHFVGAQRVPLYLAFAKMHSESHYYRLCKIGTWLRWKSSPWCFWEKEVRLTLWRPSCWLFVFPQIYLPEGTVRLFLPFNSCLMGDVKTWSKERLSLKTPVTYQQLYT